TGLTGGTTWSVTFAGATYSSTTASIAIPGVTNGSYAWSVNFASGYNVGTASGTLTVVAPAAGIPVPVAFTAYPTCTATTCYDSSFQEGGLESGTTWSVVVARIGSVVGNTSLLTFPALPVAGSPYTFNVVATVGYNTTMPTGGTGTFTNAAGAVTTPVFFEGLSFTTVPIFFESSGLAGGSWSIQLNGFTNTSTSPTIVFWEVNNTYPFAVGTTSTLTPIAAAGQVTVAGMTVVNVPFTATPLALTFTESGLATGVAWGVTLVANNTVGGIAAGFTLPSTTTTAVFNVGAGVWNYSALPLAGWTTTAGSGQSTVSAATGVTIPYTLVTYPVTYYEVGLPAGDAWTVTATFTYPLSSATGTATDTSMTNTLTLNLPNGTATYTVAGPTPAWSGTGGSVNVAALPNFAVVVFSTVPFAYAVTFSQTGVPTGATWSVTVNGAQVNSTGASASFSLPNGTYTFIVTVPSGYTATPAGGSVAVNGATASVSVTVAVTPSTTSSSSNSGLSTLAYELIGLFVALAVIFLITTLYFASRKPPAANPPQSWQSSEKSTTTESKDDTSTPPPS
ncbi:MAG: hypothetical protein ACREDE_03955, partial [Thermoplasmata archaeon]